MSQRSEAEIQDGDTGRQIWECAVAMAKLMECNSQLVKGRRVLELGAGRGVTGMTATLLGAQHVVLTDLPYCMQMLTEGLALNGLSTNSSGDGAEVAELNWESPEEFLNARPGQTFDVIIGTDCVWLECLVSPLVSALRAICARSPNAEVLLLNNRRLAHLEEEFLEAMAKAAFKVAWKLCGGDSALWCIAHPGAGYENPENVDWHPDFRPIERLSLWCFKFQPDDHPGKTTL